MERGCLPALSLTESGMKRVGSEESVRKLASSWLLCTPGRDISACVG